MSFAVKLNEKYTYRDYLSWDDGKRWELIEGVPYDMTPAPNAGHQSISMDLAIVLSAYLKSNEQGCRVFAAPFDVRFTDNENDSTVVQPDLVVICDKKKIDKKGAVGAPDICIEILSPGTSYKDETEKLKLYEKHGVTEYWIVNPAARYVMIYSHSGESYDKPGYYKETEVVTSSVLPGLELELKGIWPDEDLV
jgi:Uma2 family endonuclease